MVLALERIKGAEKGAESTADGTDRLWATVRQMELRLAGLRPRVREWEENSKPPGRVTVQLPAQSSGKGPVRAESAPLVQPDALKHSVTRSASESDVGDEGPSRSEDDESAGGQ
jgi:hypothetical protein